MPRCALFVAVLTTWCWNAAAAAPQSSAPEKPADSVLPLPLQIPAQHPYLLLTRADVEKVRRAAATQPSAKRSLEALVTSARDTAAKPLGNLPAKGDTAHWNVASRLVQVGLGFVFSDDARLAEWVRDGLLAYAERYPAWPLTSGRCKTFTQSSLYEAMWAENIALAYDLVADSGAFTAGQRRHVEEDLLRAATDCFRIRDFERDPRIRDLHYRCYNFQAWHIGAVGLIGLAVRDVELVQYAVNSRYGFRHLVAHDIRDDGLFWERSAGYHHFVLSALLPFTEALFHCGVDLYQVTLPNDRTADEDCHYVTDTSAAPKSLRMMFQTPFYLAFPDLSYIALGDSDRGPRSADWMTLVAWNRYRDPRLGWLLRRQQGAAARVGFLHYYRYDYRYEDVRLNGQPVAWGRQDATYRLEASAIVARDDGVSQPDRYLLNDADLGDFVLEWTMTRGADRGREERAWVVFQTNPVNPQERRALGLMGYLPEVGRRYRFRLEVRGDQVAFFHNGKRVAVNAQTHHAVHEWRELLYDRPSAAAEAAAADNTATWKDQTLGNTGEFRNGCTLLPSSGVVVLREPAGDFTAAPRSTAVALTYGPYGGGHGHPDKLSIAVYAQGRQWIPHYGSMPYESRWKAEWTSHTLSHNTLVVDGVSQQPAGAANRMWPCDSQQKRVVGVLERFEPNAKRVAARCESAYPGLILRREVRLWRHCVVDRCEASPVAGGSAAEHAAEHQFDYVLHVDGAFDSGSVTLAPRAQPLGTKCGYQFLEHLRSASIDKPAHLTFRLGEDRLRLWIRPGETPVEVVLADGPTNSPDERKPVVILRRRGATARYLTICEPVGTPALDEQAIVRDLP